jgi:hypothetical protein
VSQCVCAALWVCCFEIAFEMTNSKIKSPGSRDGKMGSWEGRMRMPWITHLRPRFEQTGTIHANFVERQQGRNWQFEQTDTVNQNFVGLQHGSISRHCPNSCVSEGVRFKGTKRKNAHENDLGKDARERSMTGET